MRRRKGSTGKHNAKDRECPLPIYVGLPIDHAYEQNNKLVKDDDGAVSLTENSMQLLRCMVKGVQSTFRQQVSNLVATIKDMGNPFEEQSDDLLTLDTRYITDDAVIATVRAIERVGTKQFNTFDADRIDTQQKRVSKQKKRNSVFKTK
ncbi:hypothetical protein DPMN_065555 [Dreissena polymorpha]|uniref:Uncharacterized protein n=1 Tax=Dreissena polymorpha TaxID=45954 RepID=A0A9D4BS60_DREPO|nr:hypothetical protein DPMN_065555 [Dreissena polymorpha]